MKVYVLPADAFGCGHYRLIWPADVLRKQGFGVTIIPPNSHSGFLAKTATTETGDELLTSIQVPEDADVIVMQRPAHPLQPAMIDIMRSNGIAVVIDMDDNMSSIHPHNIAFHTYRHTSGTPFSWKWALESCKRATMVTTTTRSLQRTYAGHGRGRILDNYVPATYLQFPSPETGYFGWAGTTASHPNDLQIVRPAVQQLIDDGHKFRVVGSSKRVQANLRLRQEPECTGLTGLENWALTIGKSIDVGMVPLAPTSFNSAKSRLKGLEYMAVGVPFVSSGREEYRRLVRESGGGLLADSPKEWYSNLRLLMDDEVRRKELAEAGRAYMKSQTYEANAWLWAEVWTEALRMQRS